MKKDIRIYIHSRGNHTPYQIRHYGREQFRGTATEAKKELRDMVKRCREMWYGASTSDTMRDYIAEQMADVFALDCTENPDSPKWFYW